MARPKFTHEHGGVWWVDDSRTGDSLTGIAVKNQGSGAAAFVSGVVDRTNFAKQIEGKTQVKLSTLALGLGLLVRATGLDAGRSRLRAANTAMLLGLAPVKLYDLGGRIPGGMRVVPAPPALPASLAAGYAGYVGASPEDEDESDANRSSNEPPMSSDPKETRGD